MKYKGQELVIRAIAKLQKKGKNFEYYLVGGGNSKYLENIARELNVLDKIHFVGPVSHERVFYYYNMTDIYIQPSYQEGLPRAVIEAMSMACPIIGSNAGGIPELISEECVFKKGNLKSIITILDSMSKGKLLKNANKNLEKSKLYEKSYLDKVREEYYSEFFNKVKERNVGNTNENSKRLNVNI